MKYQLGYDYWWNSPNEFKYKGKTVGGVGITVLFSPIFECSEEDMKNNYNRIPDKPYEDNYLYQYFVPKIDKNKKKLDFVPTDEFNKLKQQVSLEVTGYELSVIGESIEELEQMLPDEYKGFPTLEALEITEEEFLNIFSEHEFTDLQTTSYFTVEKYEPITVLINEKPTAAEVKLFMGGNYYKIEENEELIRYAEILVDKEYYPVFPSKIVLSDRQAMINHENSIIFYKMTESVSFNRGTFFLEDFKVIFERMEELRFKENCRYDVYIKSLKL